MEDLLAWLKERIRRKEVVCVVGAGVSIASTSPAMSKVASWKGLLHHGLLRCKAEMGAALSPESEKRWSEAIDSKDLDEVLSATEFITSKLGAPHGGTYRTWLRDTVGSMQVGNPAVIEAIAALGVPIFTTNYDPLLEQVTKLNPITWLRRDKVERVLHGEERGIIHLHGHWDEPASVILGIRSYVNIGEDQHAQAVLEALYTTKTFLFIGYGAGLEDPNFGRLMRWGARVFENSEFVHVRLGLSAEAAAAPAAPDARVRVLSYGDTYGELAPFLRSLAPSAGHSRGESPYLERAADGAVQTALKGRDAMIVVRGLPQTGKTRLLSRIRSWIGSEGQSSVSVDVQELRSQAAARISAAPDALGQFNAFAQEFAEALARQCSPALRPSDVWEDAYNKRLPPIDKLTIFVQNGLLAAGPLYLVLDNVDAIIEDPWRDDFFAMLRSWYDEIQKSSEDSPWRRLRLVLSHWADPLLLMRKRNQSPFFVGVRVELTDFDRVQLERLNSMYGSPLHDEHLSEMLQLLGGHPYLTEHTFTLLRPKRTTWSVLKQNATDEDGPYGEHLRERHERISAASGLASAMKNVLRKGSCPDEGTLSRLRSLGVVRGDIVKRVKPRCQLYADFLRTRL
ncbi:AAA-like domain-containing protein [Hyalangium versicolor]|uniref:AAA-like domain-containing protein n=1 Tax=Hyalangium versicolor TaxID=2861190 RepID=UPI001CCD4852|nr:AAA-like domain-containing protein [Hyalangium versicolor]